ncbi:hypothetical protein [Clostridium amazonitimonense]|uniref:hypothetical protein n=1 Tax=Clostridium amazonitimonense TaxID=1499689 RepID=UPI00164DF977|nr:hypothetical protein [Clostridium amazonitimonense]
MIRINNIMSMVYLELKLLMKSLWSILYYGIVIALSIFMLNVSQRFNIKSIGVWIDGAIFINIFFILCCIIIGINVAQDKNELIKSLNITSIQALVGKLIAVYIYTTVIIIVPILIIIGYSFYKVISIKLMINLILYTLITWISSIIISSTLGVFIGNFIKGFKAYLIGAITLIILTPYNSMIFMRIFNNEAIMDLFSTMKDRPDLIYSTLFGFSFNHGFILDKIFLVILSIFVISISIQFTKKQYCKKAMASKLIISLVTLFSFLGILVVFNRYNLNKGICLDKPEGKLVISNNKSDSKIQVLNYNMEVILKEKLLSTCIMEIKNTSENNKEDIDFKLDSSLIIEDIFKGDEKLSYTRDKDIVKIKDLNLNSKDTTKITFKYGGRINYVNGAGYRTFFVDNNCAMLPPNFAWYPTLEEDKSKKDFNINLVCKNKVVSNLSDNKVLDNSNYYNLQGREDKVYLLSGFLDSKNINGTNVVASEEIINNNTSMLVNTFNKLADIKYNNFNVDLGNYNDDEITLKESINNRSLIIMPINFRMDIPFLVFDNYIIINEISIL